LERPPLFVYCQVRLLLLFSFAIEQLEFTFG
jgi:hypothetical protein